MNCLPVFRRVSVFAALMLATAAISTPRQAIAAPIGLMERFALAEDREAILAELIPGSEDYYFYHCLHYQNTSQVERAEATLKAWIASRRGRMTSTTHAMMDRQRLLTYDQSPQQSIDYFVKRLGIQLNHSAPVSKGARRYPGELGNFINIPQWVKDSLRSNVRLSPAGMQIAADWFLAGQDNQVPIALRDFLKRVNGSYLAKLDQLVVKELRSRPANQQQFGDRAAHQYLTLEELNVVGRAIPGVTDDNAFVAAKLRHLRPSGEIDLSQQPAERRAYLQRVEAYVRGLPASYNSLKASAAYRLLEANLEAGVWDLALFQRYLQLPRQSSIVSPAMSRLANRANLNQDYTKLAILPPIRNEQPLVEVYLEHFLRDARDETQFARFLQPNYLRRIFARTKLMAGVGNPQTYFDMLSASERQSLRDKVQLSFARNNPRTFSTLADTELLVDVKNIKKLVVRVYEMNALAFHRTNSGQLDTDVDLDGLVATHERTIQFDRPQIVKHREKIAIPEIEGRGVWIVDLVGQGLRARTLVRRGDLQTVQTSTPDGMRFTVLDESRNRVPGARLLMNNQEFAADENGSILIPLSNQTLTRQPILTDGKVAKKFVFAHLAEKYSLKAGFFIDRSLLQTGGTAEVIVRPKLTMMHSKAVDPAILQDVSLEITATDLEGIETSKQYDALKLDQSSELALSFRVPSRVAKIDFRLSGHVVGLSDRRQRELSASDSIQVASIRRTMQTVDAFLTRDGEDYVIETLGRTGEAVAGSMVQVSVLTTIGDIQPSTYLQSDKNGRVRLGPLDDVRRITYGVAGQSRHTLDLELNEQVWPGDVNLAAGQSLRLPLVDGQTADQFRLLEVRDGSNRGDLSNLLAVENGFLVAKKMAAGDFKLVDRVRGVETPVVVVEGPVVDQVLVGQIRHREQNLAPSISISEVKQNADGSVLVRLSGETSQARVHVVASRYLQPSPVSELHLGFHPKLGRRLSLARSGYVSDLRLGDEYEYVLRRRYAAKFPGVMLPQPSVLLNPWETETTSNSSQAAKTGDAPAPSAAAADGAEFSGRGQPKSEGGAAGSSDFDFLSDSGVIAANLRPDASGTLTIPADAIQGMPIVQVIVADPVNVLRRTVTTKLADVKSVDLRLAQSLSLDKGYSFERTVSVVSKDAPLDLATLGSAQVQVYADVASLLNLYRTLAGDKRLDEFQILGQWHTLSPETKLAEYSELACHELHLFLRMHDRDFFDAVIKPYLSNKKEKQFIDHWLLEDDLSQYATLWRYQQLSAAERALLAVRVPAMRPQIRRDLADTLALIKDNYAELRTQVESALRARGMDGLAVAGIQANSVSLDDMSMDLGMAMGDALYAEAEPAAPAAMGGMGGGGGGFGGRAAPAKRKRALAEMESLAESREMGRALQMRGKAVQRFALYQQLDSTKQWAESHWDRLRVVGGPLPTSFLQPNPFWGDLANDEFLTTEVAAPAVSRHLLRCADNRHSALFALAMCGLPLEAGEVSLPTRPETMYKPEHAVALVTKRLKTLTPVEGDSDVLIGQLFQPLGNNPGNGEPIEPDQFQIGQAYQGQVVISNPTPKEQLVELFWQIPAGSIALGGSQVTDSKTVRLAPFAVSSVQYNFYFPVAGEFVHYPATVSREDDLLARGKDKTFRVKAEWKNDAVTWRSIARSGTPKQIMDFLADANLKELNWSEVYHRLRDKPVYDVITKVMGEARTADAQVWGYGFLHKDPVAMSHFLNLRSDLIARVGPVLQSTLLSVDAIDRRQLEHLEYAPLVRARIHRLGTEDEILNPKFLGQYQQFTRRIGYQRDVSAEDKLPLSYYLLLQNRIEEAIRAFESLQRDTIPSQLQYDYVAGYLALHQGEYERAFKIAQSYANHPVPRWNNRFAEMGAHVSQRFELMDAGQLVSVDGKQKEIDKAGISSKAADLAIADRDRANSRGSSAVPEVIARVEDDVVRIDHRNADQIEINLYGVDLELLFSKAPFARKDLQRIAMVRPTRSDTVSMKTKTGTTRVAIPDELKSQTLLVEASVGASRSTTLYYGGELTTYVSEGFGQLQTTDAETHRPVAGAYVKVYARYGNGDVRFYKDGYTDGRGRFDYSSVSAGDAKGAQRYAILVLSEDRGATLHDVAPPAPAP